jgi:type II pantothenate kinase
MHAAIDFGLSNVKVVYADVNGSVVDVQCRPARREVDVNDVRDILAADGRRPSQFASLIVTGGRSAALPDRIDGTPVERVAEIAAIGRGGLAAAGVDAALVVSCGSGTAAIAARGDEVRHASGTAVGGGTLCGLGALLLGEDDAAEIDALAAQGDARALDLTLGDVVHGPLGSLPPDATAVNFGRAAETRARGAVGRTDAAASLVTMIAQTIALVAIGAARSERLSPIVLIGRVPSLPTMAAQLQRTAHFYGVNFVIPTDGVYAPARGALAASLSRRDWR